MRFSSSPAFTGRRSVSGAFFALLVGMGLLGGCSGGSSGSGTPSIAAGSLVGRWRQTGISTDQASITCPGSLNVPSVGLQSCSADSVITFSADQTFGLQPRYGKRSTNLGHLAHRWRNLDSANGLSYRYDSSTKLPYQSHQRDTERGTRRGERDFHHPIYGYLRFGTYFLKASVQVSFVFLSK